MKRVFVCDNIGVNEEGHLTFAGQDTTLLAKEFGTPLYLLDEERIRRNMRVYKESFAKYFPKGSIPLYASKAASFMDIYRIAASEGMAIDVVSQGEIYTAQKAGYDLSYAHFHSNNKTDADVAFAMDLHIGYFVVDNREEIEVIEREAEKRGITQKILLRLTPGIDTHTYAAVNTGLVDSKFGTAIETGQAMEMVKYVLSRKHIELRGFHCHVGSQVFAEDVFERSAVIMLRFIKQVYDELSFMAPELDLGGGYGVRYVNSDPYLEIAQKIRSVADAIGKECEALNLPVPAILMEPGRSIVADAGMTLYEVGTVKRITGYMNYVSIDGGMTDNPRYALYRSAYICLNASRMEEECTMVASLVGRCCESGDKIQENVPFPGTTCRGDIIAVCTTGAYNYSMASNYNRIPRPAVVKLCGDKSAVTVVRRETLEDLLACDI